MYDRMLLVPILAYLGIFFTIIVCIFLYTKYKKLQVVAEEHQQTIEQPEEDLNYLLLYFQQWIDRYCAGLENFSHWEFVSEYDTYLFYDSLKRVRIFFINGTSEVKKFSFSVYCKEFKESPADKKIELKNKNLPKEEPQESKEVSKFDVEVWYENHVSVLTELEQKAKKEKADFYTVENSVIGTKDLMQLEQIQDMFNRKKVFCQIEDNLNLSVGVDADPAW